MKNKKLHIINELLNEFDTGRTTNDTDKLIIDFIATEINFTIENKLNSLESKEVRNG